MAINVLFMMRGLLSLREREEGGNLSIYADADDGLPIPPSDRTHCHYEQAEYEVPTYGHPKPCADRRSRTELSRKM